MKLLIPILSLLIFIALTPIYFYAIWFRYEQIIRAYEKGNFLTKLAIFIFFRDPRMPAHRALSKIASILLVITTVSLVSYFAFLILKQ